MRTAIRIMQMDCPTEEALIRKKFSRMPHVRSMDFNLMQRVLTVVHAPEALDSILAALRSLDFTPELADAGPDAAPTAIAARAAQAVVAAGARRRGRGGLRGRWLARRAGLAAGGSGDPRHPLLRPHDVQEGLARHPQRQSEHQRADEHRGDGRADPAPVAGSRDGDGALHHRRTDRGEVARPRPQCDPGLDATHARTGERAAGRWQLAVNGPQGDRARRRGARETGRADRARRRDRDAAARAWIRRRSPAKACRSTRRPATRCSPARSTRPGSFDYRVTAAASNTTLARIIHAVEEAQGTKAPTQRFVDQFARVYTPIVFAVALAVAVVPPLLFGGAWHDVGLQGAGAAGDRLPMRARHLDAGDDRQRSCRGGRAKAF